MTIKRPELFKIYLFLLFPGYFFFHVAHSEGFMPYIGWFGILIVFAILFTSAKTGLMVITAKQKINLNSAAISVPAALFFSYMLFATILNHTAGNYEHYITAEGLRWSIENIMLLLGIYIIGSNLNITESRIHTLTLTLCFIGFAYFTYRYYNQLNNTIWLPREIDPSGSTIASYQSLASAVLYTIVLCTFIKSRVVKTTIFTSSTITLYFIGSRTEFFLMLSIMPVYVYINYGLRLTLTMAAASIPIIIFALLNYGVNERYASLISGSSSASERTILLQSGIEGIIQSPLWGDYLGQVREFGTVGAYIHNALSVFQQYGIVAFLLYCYLTVSALVVGLKYISLAKSNMLIETLIYISIISTVGIIVSKSIAWPYPALAWGLACLALKLVKKPGTPSKEVLQG